MLRRFLLLFITAAITFLGIHVGAAESPGARPPWTSGRVVGSPYPPAPYTVERRFPALTFRGPTDLAFMPGGRLFVLEQNGRLHSFDPATSVAHSNLVFDLREHHRPFDSAYSIAFHPRFAENRFLFVCYTEPGPRPNGSHISRFTVRATSPPTLDPASEKVIIRWPSGGHNGCTIAFGNDGMLYFCTGDAADPDPPDGKFKTGQDLSDLLACIARIDVDRAEGTNAYSVPSNNPFLKTPGARPEIWAFGFRNPWRMSFDPSTGDLWVGDVGWEQWEMIYRVQRGGNYGWPITEGPNLSVRHDIAPGPGPILPALAAISHADGASITGGYVYRGRKHPELRGAYLYGDWETGRFWALRNDGDTLRSNIELCDTSLKPVSFAPTPDGELLILDYNGGIYELVTNAAPAANQTFPRKLSETGLFTSINPLTPAPGVVPYTINAPMWNDHAEAELLLAVPGRGAIETSGGVGNIAGSTWFFHSNTVLARTLTLAVDSNRPSSRRRIETQLLHWDGQGWNPYTYRWNPAQTDAKLVGSDGTNDTFVVTDPQAPGGRRVTPWRFMSRSECLRCHNAWGGDALTLNWLQLNSPTRNLVPPTRAGRAGTSPDSEVRRLEALGVLRVKDRPNPLPKPLVNPHDASFPLEDRARSWLHANCAACHRFGAGGAVAMHLNFDKPERELRALDQKPGRGDFGILGARIIASGEPDRSALLYRIQTEGAGRMPHIGSRLLDPAGIRLMRDWIQSLPRKSGDEPELQGVRKIAVENSRSLAQLGGTNREPAIRELLSTMNGCLALLGEAVAPNVRAEIATAAATHTNAMVRDLFQHLLPPEQRRVTLGSDFRPETVLAPKGDANRGKMHFSGTSQCARCHTCEGQGRAFGPALDGIAARYNRSQLLDHILNPSKFIDPKFKTTVVTLRDDTEVSGFVVQRSATELRLRDESLAERTFRLSEVKESRESQLSAMPEGLLAPLTAQEAADLIDYLLSVRPR